jgi:Holliday junction resolvase RusA-like endonuclease
LILTLEYNIRPLAHQSFRIGRNGIKYKPKKVKDYQNIIQILTVEQLSKDFNIIPSGSTIFVNYIEYVYAYPKSFSKKKKMEMVYKTTKPDLQDNLNKAFFDALEGLIYEQDQNIVVIKRMSKFYGETDKIKVQFEF